MSKYTGRRASAYRPMPADFGQNIKMKNAHLRKMYKTSDATLERWRGEVEVSGQRVVVPDRGKEGVGKDDSQSEK